MDKLLIQQGEDYIEVYISHPLGADKIMFNVMYPDAGRVALIHRMVEAYNKEWSN